MQSAKLVSIAGRDAASRNRAGRAYLFSCEAKVNSAMSPFSLLTIKPISAMASVAGFIAYLLNVSEHLWPLLNGLISSAAVFASGYVLLLLRRKYGKKESTERQSAQLQIQLSDAGETVAKLSVEERRLMDAARDGYLSKLEAFYEMERNFFVARDKEKQTMIDAQKEIIASLKLAADQLRFQRSEESLNRETT